jgi:hypothetical protein
MGMKKNLIAILVLASCFICPVAFGQIPDTEHSMGIAYVSGGVGEGEASAILAEAKDWPLMLELSQLEGGRGVWIFGARIAIFKDRQQVFDAVADGPYILVNLEPGQYLIRATYQDVEQKRAVTIHSGQVQKLSLFWK